jgi:hypothetical protein
MEVSKQWYRYRVKAVYAGKKGAEYLKGKRAICVYTDPL